MKLRSLKNFWRSDPKLGRVVDTRKGDEFSMDEATEAAEIYTYLDNLRVTVVDTRFIPLSGRYVILRSGGARKENGENIHLAKGQEITLDQETACKLMTLGYIKPLDEHGWIPRKLLQPVPTGEPKRFDDLPERKVGWMDRVRGVK